MVGITSFFHKSAVWGEKEDGKKLWHTPDRSPSTHSLLCPPVAAQIPLEMLVVVAPCPPRIAFQGA